MHYIPFFGTSSPCNLLFLNLGIYGLVQATVGVGTVLIWDFCVAITKGGGVRLRLFGTGHTFGICFAQGTGLSNDGHAL